MNMSYGPGGITHHRCVRCLTETDFAVDKKQMVIIGQSDNLPFHEEFFIINNNLLFQIRPIHNILNTVWQWPKTIILYEAIDSQNTSVRLRCHFHHEIDI